MNRAFFAGNIALLSLLIACSGSAKVIQGNDASASVYKPNNLTSASAEISASTGGYINVGKAQLRIPAQALEADTTITAEVADITLPEGGAKAIGKGIRLKPEGLQFLKPAELMLCYSSTEAANLNASGAKIYYHTEDNQYVAIAGNADLSTSCVTSHIEHFSSYVAAAYSQLPGNTAPVIGGANFLPTAPLAGIPLRVRTAIDDVNGSTPIGTTVPGTVVTAFFYYRTVGSPTFTKVALQPDTTDDTVTNRYFFQIPGSEVTTAGIEYYFEATDNLNVTRRVPTAAGSFSTRTVPTAATGIRLNPTGSVNISAGFSRAFTLQATDNGTTWQNISADNFSLTNSSLGTALRTGPSTIRFNAVGAGTGQLSSTIGALSTSTTLHVVPGLLTHIELTDTNQVALAGSLELPVSQVYNFDVVGYDSYGNVAQVYPAFATTGGIGSVVVDVTGAHFTPAATVGSGSLLADLAGLTDTLSISLYVPPQVTATAPFDQTTGIALNASVGVSFSHVMDTSTLTTTTTSACVGSLQVSSDNFATCVAMASATPTFYASNTLAVIQPAANLAGTTTYKIRVTTAARNTGGYPIAQIYTTPTGFTTITAPPVAQPGEAAWARTTMTGLNDSAFVSTATDGTGNIYAVGTMIGTTPFTFGPGVTATGTNAWVNALLVKYDNAGIAQWARTVQTSALHTYFSSVAADNFGNIYVTGTQVGSGTFNYAPGFSVTSTNDAATPVLIKYNSNGDIQWVRTVTTDRNSQPATFASVTVSTAGEVYVAGYHDWAGTITYGAAVVIPAFSECCATASIVKYDSAGNALWARLVASTQRPVTLLQLKTDFSGNIYVAGNQDRNGTFTYGPGVTATGTFATGKNAVLAKYDSNGSALWARTVSSAVNESSFLSLATDASGNIYVGGYQNGATVFSYGNGVSGAGPFASVSGTNAVLLKYNPEGDPQWLSVPASAPEITGYYGVAVDSSGVYAAGIQMGNGTFNYGNGVIVSAPFAGWTNNLLVRYSDSGIAQSAKTPEVAPGASVLMSVALSSSGVFVAGAQVGPLQYAYGNGVTATGASPNGPSPAGRNALLIKYNKFQEP